MINQTMQPNEPSLPTISPITPPQPEPNIINNISPSIPTDHNLPLNQMNKMYAYQHFIPYSTFRESVKRSGIIIPRVTEAANLALRYHESMISRPPGFGKTFIINILDSLFRREKSLFERELHFTKMTENGTYEFENKQVGYETNNDREFNNDVKEILEQWCWTTSGKYHVLRFDFSTVLILSNDDESVHNSIVQLILRVADSNNLTERTQLNDFLASKKNKLKNPRGKFIQCDTLIDYFLTKLDKMNEEYVILIDDADYIMRMTEDYSNRIVLSFYHSILKHSKKYQFLFATCVFPTSIPFVDISQNFDVSTTFGFTLKDICDLEILDGFLEKLKNDRYISRLSNKLIENKSDLLNEIDYLYGGYCFSPLSEYTVLNPVSVIECIEKFSFEDYWIEKALPWREESLSSDFLNYFTIFRQTSTMLFNDVITKILKCPMKVNESIRNHYVFLLNFGLFTYSENQKKQVNSFQTNVVNTTNTTWKIPNVYMYEFMSDLLISFLSMKSNIFPQFANENSNEIANAIKDSVNDKLLLFYFQNNYLDLFVGAILASCGMNVRCHFSQPFLSFTAESLKKFFLVNVYKNEDQIKIAELTFKSRYSEGIEIAKQSSKVIEFVVLHFNEKKLQILTCEPDFVCLSNKSKKLSAQYESQELEIVVNTGQHHGNKNHAPSNELIAQAQQIDKQIFRKKTSWSNLNQPLNNNAIKYNESLIEFLNHNQNETPLMKHVSDKTPNITMQSSSDGVLENSDGKGQS